jgi:hypothetical protein
MNNDSILGTMWNCYAAMRNLMATEGRLLFSLRLTQVPFTDADGVESGFTAKVVGSWHPWHSGEFRWERTGHNQFRIGEMDPLQIQEITKDFLRLTTTDFKTTYYLIAQKAKSAF